MRKTLIWLAPVLVLSVLSFLALVFALPAFAQDAEAPGVTMEQVMALIGVVLASVATLYARWKQIPKSLPLLEKISRMLDFSQIVDSTRRLDDPPPPE